MHKVIQKIQSHNRKALVSYNTRKESILILINKEVYAGCHTKLSANGLDFKIYKKYTFSKGRRRYSPIFIQELVRFSVYTLIRK